MRVGAGCREVRQATAQRLLPEIFEDGISAIPILFHAGRVADSHKPVDRIRSPRTPPGEAGPNQGDPSPNQGHPSPMKGEACSKKGHPYPKWGHPSPN